jgi:hypothetical protein
MVVEGGPNFLRWIVGGLLGRRCRADKGVGGHPELHGKALDTTLDVLYKEKSHPQPLGNCSLRCSNYHASMQAGPPPLFFCSAKYLIKIGNFP